MTALKDALDADAARAIGRRYAAAARGFDEDAYLARGLDGLLALELKPRARHLASALRAALPGDADAQLVEVEAAVRAGAPGGLAWFVDSELVEDLAREGDFDLAMAACDALTRQFSAEFAVRPLVERDPERALAWLSAWTLDESEHPRRLVSEGTRPRLPWAGRLEVFAGDYAPVVDLLDRLREDPSAYVRRSVANHVGDLAKIDLPLACALCARWLDEGGVHVEKLVKHALRHPVKKGAPEALAVLGHHAPVSLEVETRIEPPRPRRGGAVRVTCAVTNPGPDRARALVDLVVHFVKARGTGAKTFKLRAVDLGPGESAELRRTISLADLSTRKHYPGVHRVEVQVNGRARPAGRFELV